MSWKVEMQVLFTTESVRQKVLEISESEFFNSLIASYTSLRTTS